MRILALPLHVKITYRRAAVRIGDRAPSFCAVRSLNPLSATYQVNAASQMRFSVIIPTFKRAQLLGDAIRAALAQTHTNREILIVDDGSPDDTRNVASTFGDAVRYFRRENKGKSAALNLGIAAT